MAMKGTFILVQHREENFLKAISSNGQVSGTVGKLPSSWSIQEKARCVLIRMCQNGSLSVHTKSLSSSEIQSLLSLALAGYNAVLIKWHRGPPLAAHVHLAACPAFSDGERWQASWTGKCSAISKTRDHGVLAGLWAPECSIEAMYTQPA